MGREVRRVPKNWQHPKNDKGEYIPMNRGDFAGGFAKMDADWNKGRTKWLEGLMEDDGLWVPIEDKYVGMTWTEWHGSRPNPDDYMPIWSVDEATHFMMYEDTSEGTPISPAFATPEELAQWLADNDPMGTRMNEREQSRAQELAIEAAANSLDQLFRQRHTQEDVRCELRAFLRALADRPEQPVALNGWRLVPEEMTPDMAEAARDKAIHGPFTVWRAVLAAAPVARPEPAQPMAHEPVGMVVDNEAALFDRFKGKLGNDTLLYTAPPSRPAPSEAGAERQEPAA